MAKESVIVLFSNAICGAFQRHERLLWQLNYLAHPMLLRKVLRFVFCLYQKEIISKRSSLETFCKTLRRRKNFQMEPPEGEDVNIISL